MQKYSLRAVTTALAIAVMLIITSVMVVSATDVAAPTIQQTRAKEVQGTLPGGQFAQIWLALEPETSGAQVTVISQWDRNDPADQGLNFFILDDQGVRRVGEDSLSTIALGAGSANFVLDGPDNVLGASFNAVGLATYTLVVVNESNQDANFTLTATNGFIIDDSGQVTDPNATTPSDDEDASGEESAEEATEEAGSEEAATETSTAITTTATTTDTTPADTTTTDTTTEEATTEAEPSEPAVATPLVSSTVRTTTLSGSLPEQDDQHFLGLEPEGRDVQVTLRLTFEPQDNSELARRLNFWVLDPNGFNEYLEGSDPSDVAIAAGNRVFRGQANERVASFRVVGSGSYTVIVYNNATIPGTYSLSIDGGVLIDDAGQTNEALASESLEATEIITSSTTSTDTVATEADTTDADTTATEAADTAVETPTRQGEPGGRYTVQAGDTLALIARDIYGDFNLYEELCAFNNIANCNVIEIGDVVQLPTQAQINAGATAPAPATTNDTEEVATPPTDTEEATTIIDTPAVTTTETTTDTAETATEATGETATTDDPGTDTSTEENADSGVSDTIFATLVANGNFTTLVKGLEEAGLDSALDSPGELTLFAPVDAAFVTLRNQFELSEAQLLGLPEFPDVLRFHVLDGAVLSTDISDGMSATTLQGKAVSFELDGTTVQINGANIIATDVETANGIIHVIDAVIIPPAD